MPRGSGDDLGAAPERFGELRRGPAGNASLRRALKAPVEVSDCQLCLYAGLRSSSVSSREVRRAALRSGGL
eukprot:8193887-Alexandrium_andersonii.AAC.1